MRVCHVCNCHLVDDGRVFHRECAELAKSGYEVHLFATGKGANVYQEKGVFIHPLPECSSRGSRYARLSHVAKMAAALKPDVFHVHEPDLLGPVIGKAGSRPVIYDVHESFADVLDESDWIPKWAKPVVRIAWDKWERRLVRRCAAVVVVTETIANRYYSLNRNVSVISNYPDLRSLADCPTVERDGMTCVFTGSLTPERGFAQIFEALAILKARGLCVPLELAGGALSDDYLISLWNNAKHLGISDQITYHGVISQSEALYLQNKASIGLVTYLPFRNCMSGLPNKLLECMALGLPVVFSHFPNYREVAEKAGAGIMVDPTNSEQIADAIQYFIQNPKRAQQMGEAGRRVVQERHNWDAESAKLLKMYHGIKGGTNGQRRSIVGVRRLSGCDNQAP